MSECVCVLCPIATSLFAASGSMYHTSRSCGWTLLRLHPLFCGGFVWGGVLRRGRGSGLFYFLSWLPGVLCRRDSEMRRVPVLGLSRHGRHTLPIRHRAPGPVACASIPLTRTVHRSYATLALDQSDTYGAEHPSQEGDTRLRLSLKGLTAEGACGGHIECIKTYH